MAEATELKVLDVCKITPKPPLQPPSLLTLPLTFFDVMYLRFRPCQRLFFYETIADREIVVAQLKQSLSVTLENYLPLAGNLLWPPDSDKPIVKFSEGDAVSLTIGESNANFHHLSSRGSFCEPEEYYHLLPELLPFSSETRIPVMSLQVTSFPDAGFCIGYSVHHAVLDGKSLALFMHSWAFICKSGDPEEQDSTALLPPELTPSYDRTLIRDSDDVERLWLGPNDGSRKKTLSIIERKPLGDTMMGAFELQKDDLENLKKLVSCHLQENNDINNNRRRRIHVSSFTVSVAYVWACLVRTRSSSVEELNAMCHLAMSFDCRGRVETPVPSTYFGNCITGIIVDVGLSDLLGINGVPIAAKAIGEAVDCFKEGVLEDKEDLLKRFRSIPPTSLTLVGGSNRFEHYKTDFGWGNPRMVKLTSNAASGAFNVSDSRDGNGGIELGIVLKKHETEDFLSLFEKGLRGG